MTADELAEKLGAKRSGTSWQAQCPSHPDRTPSLCISDGEDGRTLVHCFAGCETAAVLGALGLELKDLAPPEELRAVSRPREVARYRYVDENNVHLYDVVRKDPKAFYQEPTNGRRGSGAMNGVRRVLYNLPNVLKASNSGGTVIVVEGEKDADRLNADGYTATTNAQGAGKWGTVAEHARHVLAGCTEVIVVADRDKTGYAHALEVAASLRDVVATVTILEAAEGKDVSDHYAAGLAFPDLIQWNDGPPPVDEVDAASAQNDVPASLSTRLLTMSALRDLPAPAPLITSLIDLDTLALLYGRRGSYKSFLALDWALHIAYGNRWHSQAVTYGPVLYVCAEGSHGLGQRIDAWKAHHGVINDTERLAVLPEAVNLLSPSASGELADVAGEMGARFVILDTLARCTVGGDENSTKDMGLAIEQLDVIRRRSGACVMAVHHSGKDSAAGARGSSALEAAFDSVFEIGAADEIVTLKTTKQKHHPEGSPWYLRSLPMQSSVVLDLNSRQADDDLSPSALIALRSLDAIALPGGIAAGKWEAQFVGDSGLTAPTFFRHRKTLVTLGLVSDVGTEKSPRYQVSDLGAITLSQALS